MFRNWMARNWMARNWTSWNRTLPWHDRCPLRLQQALTALALLCLSQPAAAQPAPDHGSSNGRPAVERLQHLQQGPREAASRNLCEAEPDRVFVAHAEGSECIAYVATAAGRPSLATPTVFFFDGDVPVASARRPDFSAIHIGRMRATLEALAQGLRVRFVYVARPGVFGSSGDHGQRRRLKEMLSMNAAVDAIKARLGIDTIVLAGQSGGATVAAALLTLGRRDVVCAVLGSGGLLVTEDILHFRATSGEAPTAPALIKRTYFDPGDRIAGIARYSGRRIFIVGDPRDSVVPFQHQRMFAERLKAFGHAVVIVEIAAHGVNRHGVSHVTLPTAGRCALGADDAGIGDPVGPVQAAPSPPPPALPLSRSQPDPRTRD